MRDIFISHSSEDIIEVRNICSFLEKNGFSCWYSGRDIQTGEDYPAAITNAIRSCRVFLILISRNSLESEQVRKELTLANENVKSGNILEILLDDELVPGHLNPAFDYVLAGIQVCRWTKWEKRREIVLKLCDMLGRAVPDNVSARQPIGGVEKSSGNISEKEPEKDRKRIVAIPKNKQTIAISKKKHAAAVPQNKHAAAVPQNEPAISGRQIRIPGKYSVKRNQAEILTVIAVLCLAGLFMIYSGSYAYYRDEFFNDPFYALRRQMIYVALGMGAALITRTVTPDFWKRAVPYLSVIGIINVLLLLTPLGYGIGLSSTWIRIGSLAWKPSSFFMWTYLLFLAWFTEKKRDQLTKKEYIICIWGTAVLSAGLMYKITDQIFESLLILIVAFAVTWVFGGWLSLHISVLAVCVTGVCALIAYSLNENGWPLSYRAARIRAWFHPGEYSDTEGYVILQRLKAIKSAGFFGKGWCRGSLPDHVTDWSDGIFSLICEELGWLGAILFVMIFALLCLAVIRAFCYTLSKADYFGAVLSFGVFVHLLISGSFHVAVNLNLLPQTDVRFPFVSYEGNSILFLFLEVGCMLSVLNMHGKSVKNRDC